MKSLLVLFLVLLPIISCAQETKELAIKVPINATTIEDKLIFSYQLQGELRKIHNQKGLEVKNGNITLEEFNKWKNEEFYPKSEAINMEINNAKNEIKLIKKFSVNLTSDFNEKIY